VPYRDKEDKRRHNRRYSPGYYQANKNKIKERAKHRRRELRKWFDEYRRECSCKSCGLSGADMPWALEFHHRNPAEKEEVVSWLVAQGYGKERILREIAKCDVICANCHRKHHWEEAQARKAAGEKTEFQKHGDNGAKHVVSNPDDSGRPIESYRQSRKQRKRKNRKLRSLNPTPPGPKPEEWGLKSLEEE
jgi:hypothetical protein